MMGIYARVVLLAGPSGSGKSYVARRTGLPVLNLDDFYKDGDDPTLPRLNGAIDWESPRAWHAQRAVEAIELLATTGRAAVPVYSLSADRAVATRDFDLGGARLFIAEGIFAAQIVRACEERGLLAGAYVLRRVRHVTFARRLLRDLRERRKPPRVLLRRGIALYRSEPTIIDGQVRLGARAASAAFIRRRVAALCSDAVQTQHR